jgi:hypothetical protein
MRPDIHQPRPRWSLSDACVFVTDCAQPKSRRARRMANRNETTRTSAKAILNHPSPCWPRVTWAMPVATTQMLPTEQQDQVRHVLRYGYEPRRGPYPPAARNDPHLPETDCSPYDEECASRSSPARKRPIPMMTTTTHPANNHGYRRATHTSFSLTFWSVLPTRIPSIVVEAAAASTFSRAVHRAVSGAVTRASIR